MYRIRKSKFKIMAVLFVFAFISAASLAQAAGTMEKTAVHEDLAVNKLLGMDVSTNGGDKIATIDDVILSPDGQVMGVVLDYKGELVAVPMSDLRFTAADRAVYEGTTSNLDAAKDHYVYGPAPYVYPKTAYYGGSDTASGRGYYSEPRSEWGMPSDAEDFPPRGMTGHLPYSSERGPQGEFGLN